MTGVLTCALPIYNETPLENAILTIGDDQMADFGTIEANAVQEQTYSYHVSESELGNDIQVILEYVTEGTQKRVTRTIQVAQQELSVDVYAQGEVSQTTVPVGTQVEFVFTVENRGDAEITNVEVSAPGVNRGNPIEGTFSLAPGESRILSYTGEIVRNMTIEPVITYTANGRNTVNAPPRNPMIFCHRFLNSRYRIKETVIASTPAATSTQFVTLV